MAKLSSYLRGNTTTTGISTSSNLVIGSDTSTGTADQNLQVSGGTYISGNTGIGSAIPQAKLDVAGDTLVTGVITATGGIDASLLLGTPQLAGISSSISDTAVDIFVYDTRKDSDGGAWRKRTQHTSWYNETLNTSTRGSRREFPAVAVIVAETDKVTIYDGDDPDLPMWMIINDPGDNKVLSWATSSGSDNVTGLSSLNGLLCVAKSVSSVILFDFIKDDIRLTYFQLNYYLTSGRLITDRNNVATSATGGDGINIVNSQANDVAMTVLPNAPIDSSTGLPVPTIAVATQGGVSVIKDDGNVIDIVYSDHPQTKYVDFRSSDNAIVMSMDYNSAYVHVIHNIPSSDTSGNYSYSKASFDDEFYRTRSSSISSDIVVASGGGTDVKIEDNIIAANGGLNILSVNKSSPSDGMVAYATTSYNTGWMHGDIKGAFLSDTDATNVTGSEKIANYDFTADFSTQWEAKFNATTSYDATNDRVTVTSTQNYSGIRLKSASLPTLTQGKRYIMTVDIHSITNPIRFGVVSGDTKDDVNSTGPHTLTFTAGASITEVFVEKPTGSNSTFVLNSVSIREAEEDRSVNNNGLQVFGTINKSVVATGAELVVYHGFNGSNYLRHVASTNYGSPATITMGGWSKISASAVDSDYNYLCSVRDTGGSFSVGVAIHRDDGGSNSGRPYMYDTTNGSLQESTIRVDDNQWHHILGVVDGTSRKLYIDGELTQSSTIPALDLASVDLTNVGHWVPASGTDRYYNHGGYLALIKFSASAPSAEQVKKIYEDEKVLFQENAACTLYGSSDAVTALAYDDSTNLLYAGTSSGRSDFQGLRRINNTTTAVTTAISASNGLVAEQ